jgi:hypothetical protein
VPAGRRDWAEAVWAEAREVPLGWPRLAWRAGGVWLIAREAQMVRRTGTLLLFTAAAGAAAWSAWPASAVSHAATARADIIATVLLLAALPLLARWFLGPPDNRAARWLRAGGYAAVLALVPAKAAIELFSGTVPRGGDDLHAFHALGGHGVPGSASVDPSMAILLLTACGLAVILALTARRTRVAPATLAIGACTGLALGAAMYAVDPLGINKYVTAPWLRGTWTDPIPAGLPQYLVALAWILLFGAPLAAGAIAVWRCHVPDGPGDASAVRAWQGFAAGLVSGGVGALSVTVLGTGTTALLVKSAWLRGWLYHGQHLSATTVYGREVFATGNLPGYFLVLVVFPLIGLMMGLTGAGVASAIRPLPDGGRLGGGRPGGPGGPPAPEPVPDPPDDGCLADPGAGQDGLPGRDNDGQGHQGTPRLVGAGLERLS